MPALDNRPIKERLLSSISKPKGESGCWLWLGSKLPRGYGILSVQSKKKYAHRLSYETFVGPVPDGLDVMHLCDNPSCINPGHLQAGTHKQNMEDCSRKGRAANGEKNSQSKLTLAEVKEMIRLRKESQIGFKELGAMFGVCTMQACRICNGKRWQQPKKARE
jgi:hypothetical protein